MSTEPDSPWIIYGPLAFVGVLVLTMMAFSPTPGSSADQPSQQAQAPAPRPQPRPTPAPAPQPSGERIAARHVLIQYQGSMRANPTIERTQDEARARANEVLTKARSGEDFQALAREYSDGPSGPRGGDLGFFTRGRMIPAFERAAFELEVDGLSGVVETPFGFHVIQRYQ